MDFVSEFDMPHGSSSKTKDSSLVETGRPFSPAMFEGVVKNFTPDVASDFYGWTRCVFFYSIATSFGNF